MAYKRTNWYPDGTNYDLKPQEISDERKANPYEVTYILPPKENIPIEFSNFVDPIPEVKKWLDLFKDRLFSGVTVTKMIPKKGLSAGRAWDNLEMIVESMQPNHDYKEAAYAFLASEWFEDIGYEVNT